MTLTDRRLRLERPKNAEPPYNTLGFNSNGKQQPFTYKGLGDNAQMSAAGITIRAVPACAAGVVSPLLVGA